MARGRVQSWNGCTEFLGDAADGARVFYGNRSLRGLTSLEAQVHLELEFDRPTG
jgi:hypothetical protein